jgi:alkaline phosphatase D
MAKTIDLTRRSFAAGAMIGTAALLGTRAARATFGGADPFTLGVASGDPTSDGVVLWTRLAPSPLDPAGGMPPHRVPVRWEISPDAQFSTVRSGTAVADPEWGHSVHVEVQGLAPGRPYFYRFIAGGITSPVGRTRTAPARGAMPDRLRIAFSACQHYEAGYYAAHRHIAAEEPDLVLFLGDYIYEGDPGTKGVRQHRNPEPVDIDGYRARYATYKLDPMLQASHHVAPWVTTWDDHEVQDNYAGDRDKHNGDQAAFLRRRAAAYKAYYEHMPLRAAQRPNGASMRLYRTVDWGGLAQFQVIDDRQYRDAPPCQAPGTIENHLDTAGLRPDCAERNDPRRSMLGHAQEVWLEAALGKTTACWNVLTQQTLMKQELRIPPNHPEAGPSVYNTDSWDGFAAARDRVARRWRDAKTPNPLVVSGDIHAFIAGDHLDPDDPSRIIASEWVGGSISSGAGDTTLKQSTAANPKFHFAENEVRGYSRMDLSGTQCEVTFRALIDVRDPASKVRDLARFVVENGRPGMKIA